MDEFRSKSPARWAKTALRVRIWIIKGRPLTYFTNRDRMDADSDDNESFENADMGSEGDDHPDVEFGETNHGTKTVPTCTDRVKNEN